MTASVPRIFYSSTSVTAKYGMESASKCFHYEKDTKKSGNVQEERLVFRNSWQQNPAQAFHEHYHVPNVSQKREKEPDKWTMNGFKPSLLQTKAKADFEFAAIS